MYYKAYFGTFLSGHISGVLIKGSSVYVTIDALAIVKLSLSLTHLANIKLQLLQCLALMTSMERGRRGHFDLTQGGGRIGM